jgi:glyoxylase-like metal-dependent hydrolase (beta-lactamase superfamily II)
MRVREAGKVCEGLWLLGMAESCVYLLQGNRGWMLISGGMAYIVPQVLEQMSRFGLEPEAVRSLLILHAHFDHVGIVPYFKRNWPEMEVLASARAWELLRTPKVIQTINSFSRAVAERMGQSEVFQRFDLDWAEDITGRAVGEGDCLDLGNIRVQILETPGHSSCSITAWVPELGALFASDGGGIPFKETVITSGNSNYTQFQRNLERLKELPARYICADHYGYVCGEEALGFMARAAEMARRKRELMEEVYGRTLDIDEAARELTRAFYEEHPDYLLTPEIFQGVFRQMVRRVAGEMSLSPPHPPGAGIAPRNQC